MMSKEGRLFSYSRCLSMKDARRRDCCVDLLVVWKRFGPRLPDGAILERCFCPLPSYSVSAYLVPSRPSSSRPNLGSGVDRFDRTPESLGHGWLDGTSLVGHDQVLVISRRAVFHDSLISYTSLRCFSATGRGS